MVYIIPRKLCTNTLCIIPNILYIIPNEHIVHDYEQIVNNSELIVHNSEHIVHNSEHIVHISEHIVQCIVLNIIIYYAFFCWNWDSDLDIVFNYSGSCKYEFRGTDTTGAKNL